MRKRKPPPYRRRYRLDKLMAKLRAWPSELLKALRRDITRELMLRDVRMRKRKEGGE